MTNEELLALFDVGETTWLDWKRDFSEGLIGGSKHSKWPEGRGDFIRDLASLANGDDGHEFAYLIVGVAEVAGQREVTGASVVFDNAVLQTWGKNHLDPSPVFTAWPLEPKNGKTAVAVQIQRTATYPHVVSQDLGGRVYRGQVWYRSGFQNSVALHDQLAQMFRGSEPMKVERTTPCSLLFRVPTAHLYRPY